ncbi:receptor-like protein 12 [Durio zibethinus]|uniref:Receptor-like protein 12 n=1 Tax=Durio zibethinus TaxID=66656 RepID=A0A6P6AXE7_DURZI|nr:receptor-like protein 12 [Durio zibethinus]
MDSITIFLSFVCYSRSTVTRKMNTFQGGGSRSARQFLKALLVELLLYAWFITGGFCKEFGKENFGCIEKERQALLNLKKGLVDYDNLLSSWISGDKDCCRWKGVGCNNKTGHVTLLDLRPVINSSSDTGDIWTPMSGEIGPSLLELRCLTGLDLSLNMFSNIPEFIGSLTELKYLNLSWNGFSGTIPPQLGNISMLRSLDLSWNNSLIVENFEWLSRLSSLRILRMGQVDFTKALNWLQSIKLNPSLASLYLSACQFPPVDPSSLSQVNSSNALKVIHIVGSTFDHSTFPLLINISGNTIDLSLFDNQLKGTIPDSFGNMGSLEHVDFSRNQLEGAIPKSLGNLCNLKTLDFSENGLSEPIHQLLQSLNGCTKNSLEVLRLNDNQLSGFLPDMTEFPSLRDLHLDNNQLDGFSPDSFGHSSQLVYLSLARNKLTGSFPVGIGQMSSLRVLDVSSNNLNGEISEVHLLNLSKLQLLDLSFNSLDLNFSSDWVSPFQLDSIRLRSCKLGPRFPSWLRGQTNFSHLDISNSEISDVIPSWFWYFPSNLKYFNISFNNISGKVPNLSFKFNSFPGVDMSSNMFHGHIPEFLANTTVLNLSGNKFSGSTSFLCTVKESALSYLDLSNNLLSGSLPDCWMNLRQLVVLNLENNNLSGAIPSSMGLLQQVRSLRLRNNSFSGKVPSSLSNCMELELLDLGENQLYGIISPWIGENLTNLVVLRLRSNKFYGKIPPSLCHLESLQILDLSLNNISGSIPPCLNNLTAMARNRSTDAGIWYFYYYSDTFVDGNGVTVLKYGADYIDYASVVWKGVEHEYGKTLGLLKLIDLSSNKLNEEIPKEVTSLLGLITLNLSRNMLTGSIPMEIGQLKVLESLDLSTNSLFGEIPSSLADLFYLSVLNLTNNNLSGKIPSSTQLQSFSASSYLGNPGLCGAPLTNKCPGDETAKPPNADGSGIGIEGDEEWFEPLWFYLGMVIGFAIGFWGVLGTLLINQSWRRKYFQFLSNIEDRIRLTIALKMSKMRQRHHHGLVVDA